MRFLLAMPAVLFPALIISAAPPAATTQTVAEMLGQYHLPDAKLAEPFWRSHTVWGESVLFIASDAKSPATATLLLRPGKVLGVRSPRTGEQYKEGRDYTVDAKKRRLVLTADSHIPKLSEAELFKQPHDPNSAPFKLGDPQHWLLWKENGFAELQVDVDYEPQERWEGMIPKSAVETLPRTMAKLRGGKPLRIAVSGDSISAGGNASINMHKPPNQPAFPALFAAALETVYSSQVTMLNVAVGGYRSDQAMIAIDRVTEYTPDLVVVAYGMNDVGMRNPTLYTQNIRRFIDAVRSKCPKAEFILVSTSLGNPLWSAIPADQFPIYRDALAGLCSKEKHIALADVTTLWTQILARKRYYDLTGNGLNHPNDFGHRLYAQVLLEMLRDDSASSHS
jgi:acyl-CoA thioesterase I